MTVTELAGIRYCSRLPLVWPLISNFGAFGTISCAIELPIWMAFASTCRQLEWLMEDVTNSWPVARVFVGWLDRSSINNESVCWWVVRVHANWPICRDMLRVEYWNFASNYVIEMNGHSLTDCWTMLLGLARLNHFGSCFLVTLDVLGILRRFQL